MEQRQLRVPGRPSPGRAGRVRPRTGRQGRGRAHGRGGARRRPAAGPRFQRLSQDLHRLCGDGEDQPRRGGAGELQLVRPRLMAGDPRSLRPGRGAQRRPGRGPPARQRRLPGPLRHRPAGDHPRAGRRRRGGRAGRDPGLQPRRQPGGEGPGRQPHGYGRLGAGSAEEGADRLAVRQRPADLVVAGRGPRARRLQGNSGPRRTAVRNQAQAAGAGPSGLCLRHGHEARLDRPLPVGCRARPRLAGGEASPGGWALPHPGQPRGGGARRCRLALRPGLRASGPGRGGGGLTGPAH